MKVDAELSHELCTGAEAPAVKLSSVGFVLSLQGPPNNVVSGKVNNVVLAVKNMPNIIPLSQQLEPNSKYSILNLHTAYIKL